MSESHQKVLAFLVLVAFFTAAFCIAPKMMLLIVATLFLAGLLLWAIVTLFKP